MATSCVQEDIDEGLYSRQLYVLGMDAQRRMSSSSVLIYGLTGLGIEIAKNLILAGVKQVFIYDKETVSSQDLSSNFFLSESDIGKSTRQNAVVQKLKGLNQQVQVVLVEDDRQLNEWISKVQVVVLVNQSWETQVDWNRVCREHNVKFITCESRGVFGQVFVDLGDSFVVSDTTGEEPKSAMISYVSRANPGCVTCLDESRHDLETGDHVVFSQVEGMTELNDGKPRRIQVTGPFTFTIEDTSHYHEYIRGGIVTEVKMPQTLQFQPLWEAWKEPQFVLSDFAKEDRMELLHYCFRALHDFQSEFQKAPTSGCHDDYALFIEKLRRYSDKSGFVVEAFSKTCRGDISPMAAFLGGIVAQEAMKAISGKFTPIQQFFYFDCLEVLGNTIATKEDMQPNQSRYDGQVAVFGKHFQKELEKLRYFVVGAGAIGCEMLKNWSMMGLGCSSQGKIFVTDMDNIERSNLSRQLLFRTQDIGKPKSIAAAQAVKQINPLVNIEAFEARVGADTEDIFDDDFWESLSGVANALDNVQARQYVDWRCTYYRKSLIESGTLGTKGNTQVIIPGFTETYSASRDPPEKAIPICTLKNFPYQIEHTIQWARDTFEGYFKSAPEDVNQYLSRPDFVESLRSQGGSTLSNTLETLYDSLVVNRPCSFEDCVAWARFRFEDLFSNTIKQLLYSFPADMVDKNGVPFWSGTKRAPQSIQFDSSIPTHLEFIMTASNLRAQNYGLKGSSDPKYFQQVLSEIMVPEFQPKANVKIATTDAEAQEQDNAMEGDEQRIQQILESLPTATELAGFRLYPIEFDKDDDSGLHIGFVTSCSNLRASNYGITNADKYKTKLIAGRIVPAIATTTAVVTGLVCIELYKLLQYGYLNMQVEDAQNSWFVKKTSDELDTLRKENEKKVAVFKNGFVNLALPFFGFSEPILAPKIPIGDSGVYFTQFWDRFDINEQRDVTLKEFLDIFKQRFHLEISMMSYGVSIIYSSFIAPKKLEERLHLPMKKVIETIGKVNLSPKQKYLIFEMCCNDEQGEDVEVPYCRYRFRFP
ncbi:ubiquitin-activating enzyme E1 [Galdieria sulphuraria]|uniref:E1 ubiquitin-activating enzyme n=1 Tax=Galdieria sulphuraria TaxID=130081 RepID=M2XDP8_GALSU|nr:ubiquitin-activating enzyme E1 [Galdieria sulphuraria]EME28122.1 ubiquitin-activating enzyme E1 [Galdieria sulphuraria]|eukprot:XP_005704642.1 ubiquitin-activating enzyme E1 [Galdieria sulphuraria]